MSEKDRELPEATTEIAALEKASNNLAATQTELIAMEAELAAVEADFSKVRSDLVLAQADLARARSRPIQTLRAYLKYKVLSALSKATPPIPRRMARRFARSAEKRNPNRSLMSQIGIGNTSDPAVDSPFTRSSNAARYMGQVRHDPALPNILIVSHDATRTGAPILALNLVQTLAKRYNITTLCLLGGELLDEFRAHSVAVWEADRPTNKANFYTQVLNEITVGHSFAFAVVNSIESRHMLKPCRNLNIPSVILLHEFASYTRPITAFSEAVMWADQTVFSTQLTFDNAVETNFLTRTSAMHVLPQGKCIVPVRERGPVSGEAERNRLTRLLRPNGQSQTRFIVVGAGYVYYRKGIDLFIDMAMRVLERTEAKDTLFVWIGAGYNPAKDDYSGYLLDQLRRAGLTERVLLLPETSEIETVYKLADTLALTSRLDPLPNVAIDAMCAGLPVLCFDQTTGIADTLREAGLGEACVAKYLDTYDMSEKLLALIESKAFHSEIATRTQSYAAQAFDFQSYANKIEQIALQTEDNVEMELSIILDSGHFQSDFCLGKRGADMDNRAAVISYLKGMRSGVNPRKPEPGFHPFVFADQNTPAKFRIDPYADYLLRGRPNGPWKTEVIEGGSKASPNDSQLELRVALHIHAFFTDQLPDLIARLKLNKSKPDLFVSVSDNTAVSFVQKLLSDYSGNVVAIRVFPNAGRDIGPMLTGFGPQLIESYDIVGHIHTKQSSHVEDNHIVADWVNFAYSNTLGSKKAGPILDRILGFMQTDERIGIVYPDDPHIIGWTNNKKAAEGLATSLKLGPLPEFFSFPVGTMFWMRSAVLKPFVDLGLTWSDYPAEPIPIDGTMLHALERLFGVLPEQTGWTTAVTFTRGLSR